MLGENLMEGAWFWKAPIAFCMSGFPSSYIPPPPPPPPAPNTVVASSLLAIDHYLQEEAMPVVQAIQCLLSGAGYNSHAS